LSNSDIILEYLDENFPTEYCDDCLSTRLEIKPRQQVNQICSRLFKKNTIVRQKRLCSECRRTKIVNTLTYDSSSPTSSKENHFRRIKYERLNNKQIDIEKVRTEIVHMCRIFWQNSKDSEPPRSISALINSLKDENLLPRHQANMMLTLCSLRNVNVYEQIQMGKREQLIASKAWEIILEWIN